MMRLVLFQPDMPQNTGAAIRVAACFGAQLEIIGPCGFPLGARSLKRVAMDYGQILVPYLHDDWGHFRSTQGQSRIILLTTKATTALSDFRFAGNDIILLGSESNGAPEYVHDAADARLLVPLAKGLRSLNVATAGAIALYESRRQLGYS